MAVPTMRARFARPLPILLAILAIGLGIAHLWSRSMDASGPEPVLLTPETVEPRIHYPAAGYPHLTLPDGQVRTIRSVLDIRHPMHFGEYVWNDDGVPAGPVWIRVDLSNQTLSVFRAGHEIGSAVVIFGTDHKPTPTGVFPVLEKDADHRSTLYDAAMPFMLRLTYDGVAIHASDVEQGNATHGCIGIPPDFARRLFDEVRRGDQVAILPA